MKFKRHDIEYTVLNCTAVAACDHGDVSKAQKALIVFADNGIETAKHIVFGWDMPETETDFDSICEDAGAWEVAEPGHKMNKNKQEELLAGEIFEMVALGWTNEEARGDEDAFFERIGNYADGFTKEEVWEIWGNALEITSGETEIKQNLKRGE